MGFSRQEYWSGVLAAGGFQPWLWSLRQDGHQLRTETHSSFSSDSLLPGARTPRGGDVVGALEGLALSEHYGLEARPRQRCNSAEPVQGDLALQQLWEAPLQMQGSGRDHVGPERTVPGGPGMQPAARSSAEPRASSAQRPRGPQRVRAGAGRKLCMTDALLLWTEVEEATFFVHYQEKDPEDPMQKEMATHSSILALEIAWTEEPGGLWSMGSQRVGHD